MSKTVKQAHVWERDSLDWYQEPPAATEALLTVERFTGDIPMLRRREYRQDADRCWIFRNRNRSR